MTQRVLITGAAGFIGAAVTARALAQGAEVGVIVRPTARLDRLAPLIERLQVIRGDLDEPASYTAAVYDFRPTTCVHLAWYAEPGKYLTSPKNLDALQASLALLDVLSTVGCEHVLGIGTCAEYDLSQGWLRETSPAKPDTLYAAAKLSFMLCAQHRTSQLGLRFAWARLFYLYGPGEDDRRLIPAAIRNLAGGKPFAATAGEQIRDYLHVEDVATALWGLSAGQFEGVFNVCSGIPIRIADLLTIIADEFGQRSLLQLGAVPYRAWDPPFVCGDHARLTAQTGWAPRIDLRSGIAALVRAAR